MKRWLKFYKYQSKYERYLLQGVKRYAKRLRKRLGEFFKFYNPQEEMDDLWDELQEPLREAMLNIPQHFQLDVDFQLYEARVNARLLTHKRRIKYITEETWKQLQKAIQRAMERGEDIRDAVNEVLWDLETWRAERIARTESMGAINGGYLDSMVSAGITKKMWVAALDERVRTTHAEANGQVRDIAEPFQVGKALLQFPADPTCPYPEEVVNCRCCVMEYREED